MVWLAIAGSAAHAGWEYPGSQAEVFDLDGYVMTEDPEGLASSSDGQGGLLVAAYDASAQPSSIRVSRIAHDGTELWGQGGVFVPRDVSSWGQHSPVSVAPDGSGGAYVAYLETWPTYELFRFAHLTASGSVDRTVSIDNPGTSGEYERLSIELLPLAYGDLFAAWTRRGPTPRLHAARFNPGGTLLWHTDVNLTYSHRETVSSTTQTSWCVASDMWDGVLVTWLRLQTGTPQVGAQRIASDGAPWWGNDGHLLWSGYPSDYHDPVIVGDVLGGGYVVLSQLGRVKTQHLDPWGSEQWAAGGIVLQDSGTPYSAQSTEPAVCDDGAYGFIVVHGNEDLFAQRVDYWGSLLWGSGVGVGQRAGQQNRAAIVADGAQGAVLAWQDAYYGIPGQEWRVLAGMRLNGSGSAVWGPADVYSAWTVYDPHDVAMVADGTGGALCAWAAFDLSEYTDDAWALWLAPGTSAAEETAARWSPATCLRAQPNPFPACTQLDIDVPPEGAAQLAVYDPTGRRVRTLADGRLAPGRHALRWDGRDDAGRLVGNGVYLIRLSGPSFASVKRVTRVQ